MSTPLSATVTRLPIAVPDDALLIDVARSAAAQHLHLVIDRRGEVKLTPVLLPGMVKIAVAEKPLITAQAA